MRSVSEESDLNLPSGWDIKAFCAELHNYCVGYWPAQGESEKPERTNLKEMDGAGLITKFADLRAMRQAQEAADSLQELVAQFAMLAQNVIDSPEGDKPAMLKALASELVGMLQERLGNVGEATAPVEPEESGARMKGEMLTRLADARKTLDEIHAWGSYAGEQKEAEPQAEPVKPQEKIMLRARKC